MINTTMDQNNYLLEELVYSKKISMWRGSVISKITMDEIPGSYPVYSSSIHSNGLFGTYGKFMFDEELITWSVDGGGNFFYRPKHKYSVTNVSGILKILSKTIDCKYLFYYLANEHKKFVFDYVLKAHPSVIKKLYTVWLPEKDEQRKVAQILSTIDNLIDQTGKVIAKLKRTKSGLMHDLMTRGVDERGNIRNEKTAKFKNSSLGRIPDDWQIVPLSQIATLDRGKFTHRPRNDPRFYGGKYPFIQTGDVTNSNGRITKHTQTLNERGLRASKRFPKGTIVMTIAANIGDTAITDYEVSFPDSLVGIIVHSGVNYEYVEYALKTRKNDLNTISTQSAQKNINLQILNPLQIKLPKTEKEQTLIATLLNMIQQNVDIEKQYQNKLQKIKLRY